MSGKEGQFATRLDEFQRRVELVQTEIGKLVYGQEPVVRQLLGSVFARGHCLLVGVPGLAKTLMVRALAQLTS